MQRDFKPEDMGQLGTYIAIADGMLKSDIDNRMVGLLICKTKDNPDKLAERREKNRIAEARRRAAEKAARMAAVEV